MIGIFGIDLGSVGCHISSDLEAPKGDVELLDLFVALRKDQRGGG